VRRKKSERKKEGGREEKEKEKKRERERGRKGESGRRRKRDGEDEREKKRKRRYVFKKNLCRLRQTAQGWQFFNVQS